MTINNIFSILSSSELVLKLKVIKTVVEPLVQALKATVILKDDYTLLEELFKVKISNRQSFPYSLPFNKFMSFKKCLINFVY